MINIFKSLHRQGRTIVMVTHDEKIANQASKIIRLSDGRIMS